MKQVRDFYEQFDTCRQQEIPMCADKCPFRLDMLDMQERIAKKRFNAAYKSYRDCVVFPAIVSALCPGYCEQACIRGALGDPIQIRMLERSILAHASRKDPNAYNLPKRQVKAAVIGAGISGMAFALKMASRKCQVTIFEQSDRAGGQLKSLLDESFYLEDFELQFKHEDYTLLLNQKASVDIQTAAIHLTPSGETSGQGGSCADSEIIDDFDIIYIATGAGSQSFGIPLPEQKEDGSVTGGYLKVDNPKALATGNTAIFLGGSLCGKDLMHALADGINMAAAADDFSKTGQIRMPSVPAQSRCVVDERKSGGSSAIAPKDPESGIYSEDECVQEADRCIRCQCDACQSFCDLVAYYKKWPVKMRDEIFLSVKPAGSLVHKCPSRKYIAACTDCDLLRETCPDNIDLCGMIKSARHQMHQADKMPAAYKQYYLRDMDFANGKYASIVKRGPAAVKCETVAETKTDKQSPANPPEYAFFPGCNLGALNPEYVKCSYQWLLKRYPGTGMLLKCCGLPAEWTGETELHAESIGALQDDWESLGKPVLVTACLSCQKHLQQTLPEIETVTLYELMAKESSNDQSCSWHRAKDPTAEPVTVFDPCSARGYESVQAAIRKLASDGGLNLDELPDKEKHGCCGYGGQGNVAQPEFSQYVAQTRANMSAHPYLVYCSNCRDVFASQEKPVLHILDLLFDLDLHTQPGLTDRRINRASLKEQLLKEVWGEEMTSKPENSKYELLMSEGIAAKQQRLHILDEDICRVIERSEQTGRRTRNPDNGHYKAYDEIGAITLWVEYGMPDASASSQEKPDKTQRQIYNIYSHRMQIKLEAVFNGKKIDG